MPKNKKRKRRIDDEEEQIHIPWDDPLAATGPETRKCYVSKPQPGLGKLDAKDGMNVIVYYFVVKKIGCQNKRLRKIEVKLCRWQDSMEVCTRWVEPAIVDSATLSSVS